MGELFGFLDTAEAGSEYEQAAKAYEAGDYQRAFDLFVDLYMRGPTSDAIQQALWYSLAFTCGRLGQAPTCASYAAAYIGAVGSAQAEPHILRLFYHATIGDFSGMF